MSPADRVGCQVHGGVARLVVRRRGAAEEEEAGEEERHRAAHRGGDDDERARRRHGVEGREARPAPAALDDGRGGHREQGGAHDVGALRHARQADPREVRGQQRADRRADRHAQAGDDLGEEQQTDRAALDRGDARTEVGRSGGRAVGGRGLCHAILAVTSVSAAMARPARTAAASEQRP